MPRRTPPQQLGFFAPLSDPERFPTPQWQSLLDEVRLMLTALIPPLLSHAGGADSQRKGAAHDA